MLAPDTFSEVRMKQIRDEIRVNGVVYTASEWKRNRLGIYVASFVFVIGFIILWWIAG